MTRKSVQDMKARDVMSRNLITVESDEDVSSAIGKMHQYDINVVPVVAEDGTIQGIVNYEALLKRRSIPMTAKVENVMAFPPRMDEEASVMDIAETMLSSGYRAVPITDHDRIVGLVSRTDLVNIIPALKILRGIEVNEIMTCSPYYIDEGDTIEQARSLMYKLDVRALPVTDVVDNLVGVIGLRDLGNVSFRKRERTTRGDVTGEQITARIKVGSVMKTPPITINQSQKIVEAVSLMTENNISSVIVVDKNKPVGIVTQYDFIELIASFKRDAQVFVQISGLHEADPESYDMVYELIQKNIKRISKIVTPKIFTVHVTTHDEGSDRMSGDVTIRGRMTTEHELYYSTETDWNLMKALSGMLRNIEKSVRKDKDKKLKAERKAL